MHRQGFQPYQNQAGTWVHPQPYHQGPPHYFSRQLQIEDAIQIARRQVPGEVVSAELERRKGRVYYEVDIVSTEGPVYEVKVDAMTGEVLEVELD
ncbi:MAG TPA: PepSY domain-containing protein [Bacillota bacterium]|nr:PepSY domain-containing protein [Bacillota bacterium]